MQVTSKPYINGPTITWKTTQSCDRRHRRINQGVSLEKDGRKVELIALEVYSRSILLRLKFSDPEATLNIDLGDPAKTALPYKLINYKFPDELTLDIRLGAYIELDGLGVVRLEKYSCGVIFNTNKKDGVIVQAITQGKDDKEEVLLT